MQDSLKRLLIVLRVVGFDPFVAGPLATFLQWLLYFTLGYLLFTNFTELILNFDGLNTFVKMDLMSGIIMCTSKAATFYYKQGSLRDIILITEQLWPLDKFGDEVHRKLSKVHAATAKYIRWFLYSCYAFFILLFALPFVLKVKILPFAGYDICRLEEFPCFEVQYVLQFWFIMIQAMPMVGAFDGMFLVFVTYCYCAVEMINQGFQRLTDDRSTVRNKLRDILRQHNLLLSLIKKMDDFYRIVLLVQFLSTTSQLTFSLYMITSEGLPPKLDLVAHYGLLYGICGAQLVIYCIGGTVIAEQTKTIADGALYAKWWTQGDPDLTKSLAFVIEVAQKGQRLTVVKMGNLDLESYVHVLKISFQIFMLISTLEYT